MANPTIRGHQGQFKLFSNGSDQKILYIMNVELQQESTFMRSHFVGQPIPEGDQVMDGFTGSMEMEVKDASVDLFIDALTTNNLNGIGIADYTFVTTELYSDGTTQSYVYFDCQFKMSRKQGGNQEKITKRLEFQAAGRKAL